MTVNTQEAIENAINIWLRSRCNTAFFLIALHRAELEHYLIINDQGAAAEKQLYIKAAVNNYRSLCREAGIEPYSVGEI